MAVPQYSWDYVQFSEDVGSVKESVFMAGIAYDSRSRFLCAGFPAYKPGSEVAIGCFDTDKYGKGSSPVFDPFPSEEGEVVRRDHSQEFLKVNQLFMSLFRWNLGDMAVGYSPNSTALRRLDGIRKCPRRGLPIPTCVTTRGSAPSSLNRSKW